MPWLSKMVTRGEVFQFSQIEDLPENAALEAQFFLSNRIQSHVAVPLRIGGSVPGVLLISMVRSRRTWSEEFLRRFRLVGEILANLLVRWRAHERIENLMGFEQLASEISVAFRRTCHPISGGIYGHYFLDATRVRFFAGYDFPVDLNKDRDMLKEASKAGVPMGGDLVAHPKGKAPRFLVWAMRDPMSAPLQRIQIIKGWMENGNAKEKVFDVVGSDGLKPDPVTHRIPDNGATVDLKTGKWSEDKGAAELSAVWTDPEFNPRQRAFYYVRVFEDPTLRWSTYDANKLGIPPRADLPTTIQERAYTSPICYSPKGGRR